MFQVAVCDDDIVCTSHVKKLISKYEQHTGRHICVDVYTDSDDYEYYDSLDQVESKMQNCSYRFLRIHKSFLVKINQIRKFCHFLHFNQTILTGLVFFDEI